MGQMTWVYVIVGLLIVWMFVSQGIAWNIAGKGADHDHVVDIWAGVFIIGIMIFPTALAAMVYMIGIYPFTRRKPDVDDIVP